ncbi:MAG: glycosyltransferase family 4 protein [Gaiellaceae bacterium]
MTLALRTKPRAALVHARSATRAVVRPVRAEVEWAASRRGRADVAVFHDYAPPPSGGGNQFIRALTDELRRRGLDVEANRISGGTGACLFNSFNFDARRLLRFARDDVRMVHRVDGPIATYRGFDDGTDRRIGELNRTFADATILQSQFSLDKHAELGLDLRSPVVIPNAPDPAIFHPPAEREPLRDRPLRVIATSWSANPRKGSDILEWLDRKVPGLGIGVTFVGQTPATFEHIRTVGPVDSHALADLLRAHDVYLAASRDDPCSNALLEALACGLPAAFLRSGGHPELVGAGGIGFDDPDDLPETLAQLESELDDRRARIRVPRLTDVADRYLGVLLR